MLESALERYLFQEVRRAGGLAVKLAPTVKGVPDRMILLSGGRIILVELKTETGTLSPAQREWHRKAARFGTEVVTLYGKNDIKNWIERINNVLQER